MTTTIGPPMADEGQTGSTKQAVSRSVFALKDQELGAFLYADVGTELNGSTLTILSMLARLGKDPWTQAADWAEQPSTAAIDDLKQCIAQMPLAPTTLAKSREIATRLVQHLPVGTQLVTSAGESRVRQAAAKPKSQRVMMIWCGIAVWMLANFILTTKLPGDSVSRLIAGTKSTAKATVPLQGHAPTALSVTPKLPANQHSEP